MVNLIKKDYLFTKKILLFTLLYCAAVPIILLLDNDEKMYMADLLIPLVLVTAPLAKLMNTEDTKSGVIFQKTLPYSSFERVGARFLFVFSLLVGGDVMLGLMKQFMFRTQSFGDAVVQAIPMFIGFALYYAIYMTIYYWKGYFVSQFYIYFLIFIVIFAKRLMTPRVLEVLSAILGNKGLGALVTIGILTVFYFLSCFLEQRRKLDA